MDAMVNSEECNEMYLEMKATSDEIYLEMKAKSDDPSYLDNSYLQDIQSPIFDLTPMCRQDHCCIVAKGSTGTSSEAKGNAVQTTFTEDVLMKCLLEMKAKSDGPSHLDKRYIQDIQSPVFDLTPICRQDH